jgi:multidrug efflux pump subunit AcrA (membrane-fusion protein)
MDVVLTKDNSKNIWRYYKFAVPLVAIVVAAWWGSQYLGDATFVAEREAVRFSKVERGDFTVDIRGNGLLKAKEYYGISSEVDGIVEQLLVKAGDRVEVGDPLVRLINPELQRDLEQAEWELKLVEAENLANLKSMDSQKLDHEASVLAAKVLYQGTSLQLEAETALFEQNRSSISTLDFQRTKFAVSEQKERWEIEKKRLANMAENISARKYAQEAGVAKLRNDVARAKRLVEALWVRASSQGVVQEIELELGQKLAVGSSVARVADNEVLIAELKVQELQVQNVSLNQPVIINTRSSHINGKVLRIDPAVSNGLVQIDVEILEELPPEARPELSVEGTIRTADIKNTLYVNRPTFAQRFSNIGIYRLTDNGQQATRTPVKTGQSSYEFIQILGGLSEGDLIVISDPTPFKDHNTILFN